MFSKTLTAIALLLTSISVQAESKFIEGIHYKILPQRVNTLSSDKIEVTEAFSYTCGHCARFEPLLMEWKKNLPDDTVLVQLPVVYQKANEHYAKILYTAEALGVSNKVSAAVFKNIHVERNYLRTVKSVSDVFVQQGVSAQDFRKTFNSFGVDMKVRQAGMRTRAMKISGTPQMIVDGIYSVEASTGINHQMMLEIVDFLLNKIRSDKNK